MEPEFLSPEWVDALDARAQEHAALADVADGPVVIEQQVRTGTGEVAYHLVLGEGPARVVAGRAAAADLTLVASEDAARRIHAGVANAQSCLADGTLRLRGNPEVLTRRAEVLAGAGALLAGPG
ncbi:MAG: hypothetical protein FJW95_12265 [Actinobacteria bacterium]|nr:hypothetical protein [Actinomycetota bacterium]